MVKPLVASLLFFLTGCSSIPILDFAGKGSLDRKIYYDVTTNEIISNYKTPISSIQFWKYKKDSIQAMEKIVLNEPATSVATPSLKDSLAFYNFQVSIHLKDDHWRMMYHIDITKELTEKKSKIYSRFTSH